MSNLKRRIDFDKLVTPLQQHLNFLSLLLRLCNFVYAISSKGIYFVIPFVQQWLRKIDSSNAAEMVSKRVVLYGVCSYIRVLSISCQNLGGETVG